MPEQLRTLGEFGWLQRLRRRAGPWGPRDGLGLGEDTAALPRIASAWLLATVDTLVEDVHFRRRWAGFADIGYKALAASLSDIAAMGGTPRWALVALCAPPSTAIEDLDHFYTGLGALATETRVEIVGGDITQADDFIASVVVLGEGDPATTLTRAGARPGDLICVTRPLGLAAAGLALLEAGVSVDGAAAPAVQRQLRPEPRLSAGRALAQWRRVTACVDVSDALSSDICRIAEESGVGARIDVASVPCAAACQAVADRLGADARRLALEGGEDYELLFTIPPDAEDEARAALDAAGEPAPIVVGEVLAPEHGLIACNGDRVVRLGHGFDHFRRAE